MAAKGKEEIGWVLALTRTGWLILVVALLAEWVAQRNKNGDDALIIAALNERTSNAELALANLQKSVAQRQLKPKQVSEIVAALSGKIPRLGVIATRDPEAESFAIDIAANLSKAGLPIGVISLNEETKFLGFSDSPLNLYCEDSTIATLVEKAFREAGVPMIADTKPYPILPHSR